MINPSTSAGTGYEGWVWDESSGWYYDEELAIEQVTGNIKAGTPRETENDDTADASVDRKSEKSRSDSESSSGDRSSTDSSSEGGLGSTEDISRKSKRRRSKKKHRKRAPRKYPRSKAQRLVDEAEDSMDGVRPCRLDLSMLDMIKLTSRVYELGWLQVLDLSSNRLSRISPDLALMENLIDLNLRHNRLDRRGDYS